MLNNLINQVEANIVSSHNEEEIYIKDGLKHCRTCNEPLQAVIEHPITHEDRVVSCICKCTADRIKREEEQRRIFEKQKEIEKLQKDSLLGARYKHITFDKTVTGTNSMFDNALKRCKNYCAISSKALEEGYGIYLYGDSGTGKTHLTACMVNELTSQYRQTLFTNFFEISQIIRGTFNNSQYSEIDMISKISNVDFLFIDDMGTEQVTKNGENNWLQEKIFEILNKRYNNKKPTIFTSNYSLEQLINERGLMEKTVDRILEMSTAIIKIEGVSYRIKNRNTETLF